MTLVKGSTNGHRLKGALVGYGFIGARGHAPAYLERPDVDIVAVVDACAERRAAVHAALPKARVFDSAAALFASGMHLDFIDIATPPCDHAVIAREALMRGLHVLCEKPLATTAAEAAALVEQARASQRVLYPCHNYKHAPVIRSIRDILASGRIGRVRSVTLDTFRPTHAKGVAEWNPDWRRHRRWSGGGIGMDHGSHSFYLAFEWLEAWPTTVTAKTVNQEPELWDTEDTLTAVLTFPENRVARVHLTWTAGLRSVAYSIHGERGAIIARDDDIEIVTASGGIASANGGARWEVERRSASSDWMDASHTKWFNTMFDGFVRAMEHGEWVGLDALDAQRCIEVIDTAYASAADGCREIVLDAGDASCAREDRMGRAAVAGEAEPVVAA